MSETRPEEPTSAPEREPAPPPEPPPYEPDLDLIGYTEKSRTPGQIQTRRDDHG